MDRRALRGDDPVHEVANREDADNGRAIDYGQVPNAVFGHEAEALFDRVIR